jgi:hypothetical protein
MLLNYWKKYILILKVIEKYNQDFEKFFQFFRKNWLNKFDTLLDYSKINLKNGSLSTFEGYDLILQREVKKILVLSIYIKPFKNKKIKLGNYYILS